jgi:hypothetical protein
MDSGSNALRSNLGVGANGVASEQAQSPLKALLKAIRRFSEACADAKRMEMQAHKDWPALQE